MGGRGARSKNNGFSGGNTAGEPIPTNAEPFKYARLGVNRELGYEIDKLGQNMMNEFPALKDTEVLLYSRNNNSYALGGDGTVYLNRKYFANGDLERKYANDVKVGFHPKGTTAVDIIAHEYGHVAHGVIEGKYKNGDKLFGQTVRGNNVTNIIVETAANNLNKRTGQNRLAGSWASTISRYANTNPSEMIAEAFSDWNANKGKAKQISKEIIKLVKGELQ